jgi:hypothetical protein
MRKRAPRRVCSRRPVQTRLDEELVVRLSGKGKNIGKTESPSPPAQELGGVPTARGLAECTAENTNDQDGE